MMHLQNIKNVNVAAEGRCSLKGFRHFFCSVFLADTLAVRLILESILVIIRPIEKNALLSIYI